MKAIKFRYCEGLLRHYGNTPAFHMTQALRIAEIVIGPAALVTKTDDNSFQLDADGNWTLTVEPHTKLYRLAYRSGRMYPAEMQALRTVLIWLLDFREANGAPYGSLGPS